MRPIGPLLLERCYSCRLVGATEANRCLPPASQSNTLALIHLTRHPAILEQRISEGVSTCGVYAMKKLSKHDKIVAVVIVLVVVAIVGYYLTQW